MEIWDSRMVRDCAIIIKTGGVKREGGGHNVNLQP